MLRALWPVTLQRSHPAISAPADRVADILFFLALCLGLAAIMAVKLDLWRHNVLISDWVFMKNILWNTGIADGTVLYSEARFRQFGYPSYLNEHFSPLLIPLALLYKAVPFRDELLLAIHGASPALVALSLRGIGLALFADRRLAALMGIAFAFNPAVLQPTIDSVYGFHSDSLSPPLLALAAWALITSRFRLYWCAALAALLVKENIPAYGVIFGALLVLSLRYRKIGFLTLLLSAAVFLIGSRALPALTGLTNRNIGYAETFIADLLALRPGFDYTRQELFYALRYGIAFLPALAMWPFLALTAPDFLVIGQVNHAHLSSWHVLPALAVFGVLAIVGSHRIVTARSDYRQLLRHYWIAVAAVAVLAGAVDLTIKHDRLIRMGSPVDRAALSQARALVPPDAGVATTTDVEQYFAHRRVVFTSLRYPEISHVVVNAGATNAARAVELPSVVNDDRTLISEMEDMARRGTATLLLDREGLRVFRLAAPTR